MEHEPHLPTRWVELIVAALFALIGIIVIGDSLRVGREWSSDGPQPGYFPFYIGCILVAGAAWVAQRTLRQGRERAAQSEPFATLEQSRRVLSMLLPSVAYVLGVIFLGVYVSSTLFIAAFMVWQGRYAVLRSALTGLAVSGALFALFELWFLVQLPKGPLEDLLGL